MTSRSTVPDSAHNTLWHHAALGRLKFQRRFGGIVHIFSKSCTSDQHNAGPSRTNITLLSDKFIRTQQCEFRSIDFTWRTIFWLRWCMSLVQSLIWPQTHTDARGCRHTEPLRTCSFSLSPSQNLYTTHVLFLAIISITRNFQEANTKMDPWLKRTSTISAWDYEYHAIGTNSLYIRILMYHEDVTERRGRNK